MSRSRLWSLVDPPLSSSLLSVISNDFKFSTMTPVQTATIPLFLKNKDVAVQACTGSGKTLCFLLPILEILIKEKRGKYHVGAIVISPTRELAGQIFAVLEKFMPSIPELSSILLVGGTESSQDFEYFRINGGNIVVATPGRLEETMAHLPEFNVSKLEMLILDEADRLLDMGFEKSINTILKKLPKQRRTGLFSATQTSQVEQLIRAGLRNPAVIEVSVDSKNSQATPATLNNYYMILEADAKLATLVDYLLHNSDKKIVVFFLTCAMVDYFYKILSELSQTSELQVIALHGQMPQNKRTSIYKGFLEATSSILLTTDLIARGVDIPLVDTIIQYDPPQDPSFYIHRVGRTARAGNGGLAIVYLQPSEDNYVEFLRVKNVPIELMEPTKEIDTSVLENVKELALNDRDIMEKAQKAFVSFVRSYKEHQCNYIFRLAQLDLGKVATGMALLYFPIMSEIRHKPDNFIPADVLPSSIKYKDKQREKQRLQNEVGKKDKVEAQKRKRELIKLEKEKAFRARLSANKTKRKYDDYAEEWKELQAEMRLAKKLDKGIITLDEYERESGEKLDLSSKKFIDM